MADAAKPILTLAWRRGIAIGLLALKFVVLAATPVFMDEAYYWLWGQHPDLSYFDHPPLNAWLQSLSGAIFGWNIVGVRAPVALTLAGDLWLLRLFAHRLAPLAARETFWLSAILFLATPVFFGLTNVALSDHLLLFFGLAALYGFHRFLAGWQGGEALYRYLYLGALALGLAGLSKYNAALIGVALLAFLALGRAWRPLLRDRHLYFALALALLMQAPVLLWNIQHGLASFDFILGSRHGGQSNAAAWSGVVGFLLGMAGVLGPFLLLPLARFLVGREGGGPAASGLGRAVFWTSSLVVFGASLLTDVLFHWNLVAYVGALPFLALCLKTRWVLIGQVAYGLAAGALALVNYSVVPVMALVSYADQTTAWSYGWSEVAARVKAARAEHPAGFVAATDYTLASQLAFALEDDAVTSLSAKTEQFDFWFVPGAHAGENAIVVADAWRPLRKGIEAEFDRVTPIDTVTIERHGRHVGTYVIYLAEGYRPPSGRQE